MKCHFIGGDKYHCELNQMELIWSIAKHRFAKDNTFDTKTHEKRLIEAFKSIKITETVEKFVKHSETNEERNEKMI